MMNIAFKEWDVVCRALACGRQTVILRKGGIVETGGMFRPEHAEFLLLPTHLHQSAEQLVEEVRPWLAESAASQPDADTVTISHVAQVADVWQIKSLERVERLRSEHVWSDATIAERFHRWQQSIYALMVRVCALRAPRRSFKTAWEEGDSPVLLGSTRKTGTVPSGFETGSVTIPMLPSYAGCKSWVELEHDVPVEGAIPVVADAEFEARRRAIREALGNG